MSKIKIIALLLSIALVPLSVFSQKADKLKLEYCDQFEVVREGDHYVTFAVGNARFRTSTGLIRCDSAIWRKGESVRLNGNVFIDDEKYLLRADSVFYDIINSDALARGQHVELWSYEDSIYATGTHAFFNRRQEFFYMEERPTLFIDYPDTARMIQVVSDYVEYHSETRIAEAVGNVEIISTDISSQSGCAILHAGTNDLDLFENPKAQRGSSEISGALILISFENDLIRQIDVLDSAEAEFVEPTDSTETAFDRSTLRGRRIIFDFKYGVLDNILCYGQAYSWYYPSTEGKSEYHQNTVSGDTIRFIVEHEQLKEVDITGGGIGMYLTGKIDEETLLPGDTIEYQGEYIEYSLRDSVITLNEAAHVTDGSVSLDAHLILFDTEKGLIEAFSASVDSISDTGTTVDDYSERFQPGEIPVVLRDGGDEVFGNYLLYSVETEKGRIVQSKSDYEKGRYYGEKLFREQENIFYVCDGRYTTCDADEPHFHFHSSNMKLIEGEKLIAKPVIFYIERIPILALPYYIFPLKSGRHSGFLPFTFGKFQKGERYIRDVGYYWAASEFWDWKGSFDYFEENQNLTFNSRVNFNKRYVLNGYLAGSYLRDTNYDYTTSTESKRNRWVINSAYNHTVSPSFNIRANGRFVSDKTYYSDYSLNSNDRLDRLIKSQVSFSKKFGKNISLSGNVTHTVNLDQESRTDNLPTMSLSLPTIWPFGNGSRDADGKLQQSWYQRITFRYSPRFRNYSSRETLDSAIISGEDTTTVSWRTRKKYARIDHNPSLNLPAMKLSHFANIIPRFSYSESWYKIYSTDQSEAWGIDASTTYRAYSYSAGVTANTTLYGTIYPNVAGLAGLRQVLTPSVTYAWSPEIDRHPAIRSFAGGGPGSAKSSRLSFSLNQSYQAKVGMGESQENLQLLSITSSFSYNFENETRPYSGLSTTYQSGQFGRLSFNGRLSHSFYRPGTDEVHFWSPYLEDFSFNARLSLGGKYFIFEEPTSIVQPGVDSLPPTAPRAAPTVRQTGWNLSATYRYSESGRDAAWRKRSFINFSLRFNLTPTTSIAYSQYYDINQQLTIRNTVNIVKTIHCWTGSLYWVPIGSNRGFGFKLFVTQIPEIKLDNKHDSFLDTMRR